MSKQCCRCNAVKVNSEFTKRTAEKDGLHYMCKVCSRLQNNLYNEKDRNTDRERYRARGRRYRAKYEGVVDYCIREILHRAKNRAKNSGVLFSLTKKDIIIPDICPILGLTLRKGRGKREDNSPSLDRVIPSLGYVPGNVVVMCDKANRIKNEGTPEEHDKIAAFMRAWKEKNGTH